MRFTFTLHSQQSNWLVLFVSYNFHVVWWSQLRDCLIQEERKCSGWTEISRKCSKCVLTLDIKGFYTLSKLKVIYHTRQIVIIKTTFSDVQYVRNIVVLVRSLFQIVFVELIVLVFYVLWEFYILEKEIWI